jgi:arylsulfatase A-like enzyme
MLKHTCILWALAGSCLAEQPSKNPNIVFVFNDDHTRQAIGAYGGRFAHLNPTPHIDQLAAGGMRFDRCYVGNSICAPSRATVLTGKHSHKNGKHTNSFGLQFKHGQQTFPQLLQKAGYRTALVGKTHLMHGWKGFDHLDYFPGGGDYYQPTFFKSKSEKEQVEGYVTDLIMARAISWMDAQKENDEPFMIAIWNKAPHREFLPAIRHADKWHNETMPIPENYFDTYENRKAAANNGIQIRKTIGFHVDLHVREMEDPMDGTPMGKTRWFDRMTPSQQEAWDARRKPLNEKFLAKKLKGNALLEWKYQRYAKEYLRTCYSIDENVGRLMEYLKSSGLDENTVVVYSSDQGFFIGEHGFYDKRFMYEESYGTPLIVRWPGMVRPNSANKDLVQNIDFAPTFLDMAGVDIPEDMQGESLLPLLKGETPTDWRKSLYYHYPVAPRYGCGVWSHEGVSTDRFKLIRFYGKEVAGGELWEFYDLKNDPLEMDNRIDNPEYAEEVSRLKRELRNLVDYYEVPDGWPLD